MTERENFTQLKVSYAMQSWTSVECVCVRERRHVNRQLLTGLMCTGTKKSFCKPTICNRFNSVLLGSKPAVVIRGIFFLFGFGEIFPYADYTQKKRERVREREITFRYSLNDLVTNLYEKPYTG